MPCGGTGMTKVDLRLYALLDPEHVGGPTLMPSWRGWLRKAARRWCSCATSSAKPG